MMMMMMMMMLMMMMMTMMMTTMMMAMTMTMMTMMTMMVMMVTMGEDEGGCEGNRDMYYFHDLISLFFSSDRCCQRSRNAVRCTIPQ